MELDEIAYLAHGHSRKITIEYIKGISRRTAVWSFPLKSAFKIRKYPFCDES